jgi:hypothetical protein
MAGLSLEMYASSSDIEDNPCLVTRSEDPHTEDPPTEDPPAAEAPAEDPPATEGPAATSFQAPLPPLDKRYHTPDEGIKAINDLGLVHGYAVVIQRSKKTKGSRAKVKKVQLQCDRGGNYTPMLDEASRKRKTTTIALGCPFNISLRLQDNGLWLLTVANNLHNHEPSPPTAHPTHRKQEFNRYEEKIKG